MKIKQKVITLMIMIASCVGISGIGLSPVMAASQTTTCGGATTSIISCPQGTGAKTAQDSGVWAILLLVLNIMTGGIGILAVGGIVYGSILYASAADRADQTKKAISIITNVVIGIIAYGMMYLLLNFLIPGGIFT